MKMIVFYLLRLLLVHFSFSFLQPANVGPDLTHDLVLDDAWTKTRFGVSKAVFRRKAESMWERLHMTYKS